MRFEKAILHLIELKQSRPELQSEVDMAIQMITGRRPGIEEKYDALLIKLDRTYSQLVDRRDHFKVLYETCENYRNKPKLKAHIKAANHMITNLAWMRARNIDMIKAAGNQNEIPARG